MLDPNELFRSVVVLNALFASLAWCLARTNRASMLSVVLFAVIWPFVDKPLGGRTVYVISENHGITTGDFLSAAAVAIVVVLAVMQSARVQRAPGVPDNREADSALAFGLPFGQRHIHVDDEGQDVGTARQP